MVMRGELGNINGSNLINCCENNDRVECSAWRIPQKEQRMGHDTWNSHDGSSEKQIDYIIIEKRYRNWVQRITNNVVANPISPMQHSAIIMDIRIARKEIASTPLKTPAIHMTSKSPERTQAK